MLGIGFGWAFALAGVLVIYASGSIARLFFLPGRDSRHSLLQIYGSMARRYADYERDGDKERAVAMRHLLDLFEEKYPPAVLARADTQPSEKIISKTDADHIFSLDRAAWESYAKRMVHPGGWEIQLARHDTGTGVMAFDAATGMGLSTQPLYSDAIKPPMMLIVGSYYPVGILQTLTSKRKAELEKDAQADLGKDYTVTVRYFSEPPVDGIELQVRRSQPGASNAYERRAT